MNENFRLWCLCKILNFPRTEFSVDTMVLQKIARELATVAFNDRPYFGYSRDGGFKH